MSRLKVINRLEEQPDEINVIWLKTPYRICAERNSKRIERTKVPEEMMKKMYNAMEAPNAITDKHIHYLYIVDYETNSLQEVNLKENKEGFIV